jgi:hypothetical protein
MHTNITIALLLLLANTATTAAESLDAASFALTIEQKLRAARYMEKNCNPASISGWEGFETQKCTYSVKDSATGNSKSATVVLLNPSALKLSEWIINACKNVTPSHDLKNCAQKLFRRVLSQSGGQYPVAGVVYEDIIPKDGVNEAYGFRNGVTTIIEKFPHRATASLTQEQIERALSGPALRTASHAAYARPIGVTRDEYLKANPGAAVDNLDWLSTVRTEYQRAWKSDRNSLIEAWLKTNAF